MGWKLWTFNVLFEEGKSCIIFGNSFGRKKITLIIILIELVKPKMTIKSTIY